jgi:hypothetical protein
MDPDLLRAFVGSAYELTLETVGGSPVIRARCIHPETGMKITLTFPVTAAADLRRFKERAVKVALAQAKGKQGTA